MVDSPPAPMHRLTVDDTLSDAVVDALGLEGDGLRQIHTASVYEQACTITAWQQLYDQIQPGHFMGSLTELWLSGLQCFEETTSLALRQSCVVWPQAYWFGLPYTEGKDASNGDIHISDDAIAVSPGGQEFELTTPDNFHIMGLVMPQAQLEQHAAITLDDELPLTLQQYPVLKVDIQQKRRFIQMQRQLLAVVERQPQYAASAAARKFMKHELLGGLVELLVSAQPAQPALRSSHSHWRTVRKARDFVLDHPDQPVAIADLCQYLNVSRRTLQNCFHNTLGVCALDYLKAIRLNAVKRELQSANSRYSTVQDSATAWGFWHLSQFAVDYQRLFGEKPSQTLLRR